MINLCDWQDKTRWANFFGTKESTEKSTRILDSWSLHNAKSFEIRFANKEFSHIKCHFLLNSIYKTCKPALP